MKLHVPTRSRVVAPATELRALDAADGSEDTFVIRGHAAVFDSLSEDLGGFRERVRRGAFKGALDNGDDVRLLLDHTGIPLARTVSNTLRLWEDPRGLAFEADVLLTERTREVRALMQRGDLTDCSFQFLMADDQSGETWSRNGDQVIRSISRVKRLLDVAIVTFPAYRQAGAVARSIDLPPEAGGEPELGSDVTAGGDPSPTDDERAVALRLGQAQRSRSLALARHSLGTAPSSPSNP